jgi:ketosteroid isomerase-like protein
LQLNFGVRPPHATAEEDDMPATICRRPSQYLLAFTLVLSGCGGARSTHQLPAMGSAAEERAIREARAAQNRAIAAGDIERVADFWTEDVEIRRGLGQLLVGRAAYRQLFVSTGNRDSALVYQREPTTIDISPQWPLAFESGTWTGHLGRVDGPTMIRGRYAAQWVRRATGWLIRGEVFVALTCANVGCTYPAAP